MDENGMQRMGHGERCCQGFAISFFNEDETGSFRLPGNHAESCEHYGTKKTTIQKEFVWLSGERFENLSRDARARTGDLCNVTAAL